MRFEHDEGGPYPLEVKLGEGKHKWCACGRTQKVPFCDGTCDPVKPVKFYLEKKATVRVCNCGLTSTPPYCDDSHRELARG